jgi:RNA polymerase sigma factor (sigma-70 family)
VCRRVLSGHDVDDAFQATFLALAKEAGLIRNQGSLGAWLYEVAYHAALRIRARTLRNDKLERASATSEVANAIDEVAYRDMQQVLDEELHQLPEQLRRPIVLVHLLGHAQAEAASELGITDRALRKRLRVAREKLRASLTRRGVTLSATALAVALERTAAAAAVPPVLLRSTVDSVLAYAAGEVGAVATSTVTIALAGTTGWLAGRFKLISLFVVAAALIAGALAASTLSPDRPVNATSEEVEPVATRAESRATEGVSLSGRVLDAAGQPVPFANVTALVRRPWQPDNREIHDAVVARATTDAVGRYVVRLPRDFLTLDLERRVTLLAHAAGHAPTSGQVVLRGKAAVTDLRLPSATTAHGRLLTPDGQPATNVRLAVVRLGRMARGDRDGELPPGWPGDVTTGRDGRYRFDGLPPGETLWLQVHDERYAQTSFALKAGAPEKPPVVLVEPRILTGQVHDRDTQRPLQGARIAVMAGDSERLAEHFALLASDPTGVSAPVEFAARTDAQGRFRLRLPPEESFQVFTYSPDGAAYAARWDKLVWHDGEASRHVSLWLIPGVAVEGRVVEEDGRPVSGANAYFLRLGAGSVPRARAAAMVFRDVGTLTDRDGRFRLVALPGKCQISVIGPTPEYRLQDYTLHRCPDCGRKHVRRCEHARVELTLESGARPEPLTIVLRRGLTITGRVVGPNGEAIRAGLAVCRAVIHPMHGQLPRVLPIHDGTFELLGCIRGRTYPVLLMDAARSLVAVAEVKVPKAGEGPPTIRLAPCGTAKVRLIDAAGKPLALQQPRLYFWLGYDRPAGEPIDKRIRPDPILQSWLAPSHYLPGPVTDAAGFVSLPAIIPGLEHKVAFTIGGRERFSEPFQVAPGQSVRVPDVKLTPAEAEGL